MNHRQRQNAVFVGNAAPPCFWDGGGEPCVMAGTMDNTDTLISRQHIFVADKGAYYDISDSLPQYPQSSPPETR